MAEVKLTKEFIGKMRASKNAEELMEMLKENGQELTPEQAQELLEKALALTEEDMEKISGGSMGSRDFFWDSPTEGAERGETNPGSRFI